jgi:HlyD family secretion protein
MTIAFFIWLIAWFILKMVNWLQNHLSHKRETRQLGNECMKIPITSRTVQLASLALLFGTCGAQIVKAATAPPVTVPLEKDAAKADRVAPSRDQGIDVQAPLPVAGGALIGGNGLVEPAQRETRVAAQVSAVVQEVFVKEGDHMKANDILVQLANKVETAAVQAAQADVDAEKAALAKIAKGLRIEDRDATDADAQAAQSRAELSAGILVRTEQLAKSGAATPDELERARRQAQTDAANAKGSAARLRAAQAGSRGEDVTFQRARVLAAQARLSQAQATLDRLSIRAASDGEVLQVKVRVGELYSFGGEPLLVIGDTRKLRVRMDVDERDIAKLKNGAAAYVVADAFGTQKFAGKVVEIGRRFGRKNVRTDDPTEKNDTKILEAVIELDSNQLLVPGQRVTAYVSQ